MKAKEIDICICFYNTPLDYFKECLDSRGRIVSIEPDSAGNYEIWIVDDFNEALVYYLFPYDLGVIEHGMEV